MPLKPFTELRSTVVEPVAPTLTDKLDGLVARAKSETWNRTDTVAVEGEPLVPVRVTE